MKIIPFKQREISNVVLSTILAAGSIFLAVILWLIVADGGEHLILLIPAAMLPTAIGFMSLMSLMSGKPWYLEVLVVAALLGV